MLKKILGGISIFILLNGCSTKYHCYKVTNNQGLEIKYKEIGNFIYIGKTNQSGNNIGITISTPRLRMDKSITTEKYFNSHLILKNDKGIKLTSNKCLTITYIGYDKNTGKQVFTKPNMLCNFNENLENFVKNSNAIKGKLTFDMAYNTGKIIKQDTYIFTINKEGLDNFRKTGWKTDSEGKLCRLVPNDYIVSYLSDTFPLKIVHIDK